MDYQILKSAILTPVYFAASVGNVVIFLVVLKGKMISLSYIYIIILGMTVADFILALLGLLAHLGSATGLLLLGAPGSDSSAWAGAILSLGHNVDHFSLTSATVLQTKAVLRPGWIMTRDCAVVVEVIIWLLPLTTMTTLEVPLTGLARFAWNQTSAAWEADFSYPLQPLSDFLTFAVYTPTVGLTCLVADVIVLRVVYRSTKAVASSMTERDRVQRERKNRTLALQFVYLNCLYFFIYIFSFFALIASDVFTQEWERFAIQMGFHLLDAMKAGGNFVVYYLCNDAFRKKCKGLFCCAKPTDPGNYHSRNSQHSRSVM